MNPTDISLPQGQPDNQQNVRGSQPLQPQPQTVQPHYQPDIIRPSAAPAPVPPPAPAQAPTAAQAPAPSMQQPVSPVAPAAAASPVPAPAVQDYFAPDAQPAGVVTGTGGVFGSDGSFPPSSSPAVGGRPPRRFGWAGWSKKRRTITAIAVAAVVTLAAGGGVFGLYLPNKPENVYKSGVSRTGVVMDRLTSAASQKDQIDAYKSSALTGTVQVESEGQKYTGTISSKYGEKQSDTTFNYRDSAASKKLAVQIMTDLPAGKAYPNAYFKVSGLQALGLDEFLPPVLLQYDGKWIFASSDYLATLIPADTADNTSTNFTSDDAVQLSQAAAKPTKEYVFSNDPDKAVLTMKRFVGTEKSGTITANRYDVGINKPNAKKYCRALTESVMSAPAYKKLPGVNSASIAEDKASALKECDSRVDRDLKDNQTFGMWVDKHTKLIHKIRITEADQSENYVEVGQSYTGGNVIPLFANFHSKTGGYTGTVTFDIDGDKHSTRGTANFTNTDSGSGSSKFTVKANFEFKPNPAPAPITIPSPTVPLQDVLKALRFDGSEPSVTVGAPTTTTSPAASGSVQSRAKDTERQTDIRSLQSQLEVYYAVTGSYPSLTELNTSSWRRAHMSGLDDQALNDPDGSASAQLLAVAIAGRYGYATTGCDAAGKACTAYQLTAVLSDGSKFTKTSLN